MYKHIINGLNNMSYEDFWWDTHNEIERLGLRKEFDKQVEKMQYQEKHKYKDTRQVWEYDLNKVRE